MWIVTLETGRPYGPFTTEAAADFFARFLTSEVDPATVVPLADPATEIERWRDATDRTAVPVIHCPHCAQKLPVDHECTHTALRARLTDTLQTAIVDALAAPPLDGDAQ